MNLHRRWAGRRAWRTRFILAAVLAVASWLLRGWLGSWLLVLPLLGFVYPSRYEEGRALTEIDRHLGLVYRTALETPPTDPAYERLLREARRLEKTALLPRFPWLELFLAGSIWLAAALLPLAAPAALTAGLPADATQTQDQAFSEKQEAASRKNGAASQGAPNHNQGDFKSKVDSQDMPTSENYPSKTIAEESEPKPPADAPMQNTKPAQSSSSGAGPEVREKPSQNAPGKYFNGAAKPAEQRGSGNSAAKNRSRGEMAGEDATVDPAPKDQLAGGEGSPPGQPSEAGAQVLKPKFLPQPVGQSELPRPWVGGSPPENVQQAAERYIENNPLSPGAAEALRRYFELDE